METILGPVLAESDSRAKRLPAHLARILARRLRWAPRVALGLIFFTFGLDYFLGFLPRPSVAMPGAAMAFAGALMKTGYMFPLIKGTEVLAGALLLANRFVPLALAIIAPVIVNILAFQAFLAPSGLALASVVLALELLLAWTHRDAYRSLLAPRSRRASF